MLPFIIDVYLDKDLLSHILTVQRTSKETNRVKRPESLINFRKPCLPDRFANLMSVMQIQAADALNAPSEEIAEEELNFRELLYQEEVIKGTWTGK